ncbi:MAG: hypothetical protein JNG90_13480 [Planctomycetaceae bacterium]|nr:hypothetical protein [Planctomycetaceae bacterium]
MDEPAEIIPREPASSCEVVTTASLSGEQRTALYRLMADHFENVDAATFFRDLDEKQFVVLLHDSGTRRIVGFSTITSLETELAGEPVGAVFAGDTIFAPELWGQSSWLYRWGECGFQLARQSRDPRAGLLLLTSTHRSYRFLPGFFHEFYPRFDRPTPPEVQARSAALVRLKFPQEYDPATGVVAPQPETPVRPGREDPAADALTDPHAQYFLRANPGFARGNYLACFAELTWENLTPLGRRVVAGPR